MLAEVAAETGVKVHTLIGTMIEVPRAALTAGQIAEAAEFFSFGTNDLTQMGWGFSRDDVEGSFFSRYIEMGIFGVSPFETLDADGIGRLVKIAVEEGRATRPDLKIGVCGEHGGDPESVHFFHEAGLDYVSCSPFRVPVARLEAGRAAVLERPEAATAGDAALTDAARLTAGAEPDGYDGRRRRTTATTRPGAQPSRPRARATAGAVPSSGTGPGCCTARPCAGSRRRRRWSR